ncbi:hypothetical protein SAY86_013238 [Trapa natans]|uniref:Uncharacterized protein n=1 Tax=Trapa natans TaxID=22666 RepID=A0AAN7R7X7_TRANT|nr:hypothetical protein SAY86_013238 [Trapa natans]
MSLICKKKEEMQSISSPPSPLITSPSSPSLTCYSSGNSTLAEIAARVARELSLHDELGAYPDDGAEDFFLHKSETEIPRVDEEEDAGDGEFEFPFVSGGPKSSSLVSADEIFHNGQIRPMYEYSSLINLGHIIPRAAGEEHEKQRWGCPRRAPLKLLMTEDYPTIAGEPTEAGFSCSSSESDELEVVPAETYCVWIPPEARGKHCRKSSSTTGSGSRRWKLKHLLLNRSNSDGRVAVPLTKASGVNPGADGFTEGRVLTEGEGRRRAR